MAEKIPSKKTLPQKTQKNPFFKPKRGFEKLWQTLESRKANPDQSDIAGSETPTETSASTQPLQSRSKKIINLLAITNIATILLLGMFLSNLSFFQARFAIDPDLHSTAYITQQCSSLQLVSWPDPLSASKSAIIGVKASPENFSGNFRLTTDGGILNDLDGNSGAIITTQEKKVAYAGGDMGATITVQALGEGNEKCLATLQVSADESIVCSQIYLNIYPDPLPANESAEIKIMVSPPAFSGNFLVQSESGKFQITELDAEASGNNSKTVVTNSRSLLFSGGKKGENIVVRALGEKNSQCISLVEIGK